MKVIVMQYSELTVVDQDGNVLYTYEAKEEESPDNWVRKQIQDYMK